MFGTYLPLLVIWVVPAVVLFFLIYWAVRLAIRHEARRDAESGRSRMHPVRHDQP
jgi:hypothetical protein